MVLAYLHSNTQTHTSINAMQAALHTYNLTHKHTPWRPPCRLACTVSGCRGREPSPCKEEAAGGSPWGVGVDSSRSYSNIIKLYSCYRIDVTTPPTPLTGRMPAYTYYRYIIKLQNFISGGLPIKNLLYTFQAFAQNYNSHDRVQWGHICTRKM